MIYLFSGAQRYDILNVAEVRNPYFLRIAAKLCTVLLVLMMPLFAQINVLVETGNHGPVTLVLDGAVINSQPVAAAIISGLDTNQHQLQVLMGGKIKLTRKLHFIEAGNHRLVLQINRAGQWVLRYRGTFENTGQYQVFLMDLEKMPEKPAPQIAEVPQPKQPTLSQRTEANLKPSLKPIVTQAQALPGEFERLSYLKTFLSDARYNVADLMVLGDLLKFEHTRLQFFVAAYDGVEDPENYAKLEELLEFEVSKTTLQNLKNN